MEESWFFCDKAMQQLQETGTPNYKIKHCISVTEIGCQIAQKAAEAGYPVDETGVVATLAHEESDLIQIHIRATHKIQAFKRYPETMLESS